MSLNSISRLVLESLLIGAGFVLLDRIWINALPEMGISYGRTKPALAGFISMRGIIWLFWLVLLGGIAVARLEVIPGLMTWLLVGLNILLLGLGIYSLCIEPMQLSVSRIEVPVPGLSHSIRIVQLSDIHVERTTRRESALPGLMESLHPDMIVMTGDYLNWSYRNDPTTARDLRKLVEQLQAPLGIYAVNGNLETPVQMHGLLDGLGVRLLENDVVRVPGLGDHFVIIGLNHIGPQVDDQNLLDLMKEVYPGDFALLLYHKPDLAYVARDLHVNLYLSGHTHGGQVRLPFFGAIFPNSRYGKTFEMGLYHLGETTLYVSRGLGMVGGIWPRVRFLAPPEVVVVDLVPQD